jgi:type IV pilus assembly protein PilM
MATKQPGVWGIDLGQCAVKAIRLEQTDGKVTATAFDYIEHAKILSQPDADPDQLIREALERFLSRNDLRGDMVAISVPGQSGLARFVKLPPVEEKKITDIVRFEAKQQIPFPLDEVVWDFQKVGAGVVTDGFALETEIGLFAMKRDLVNRYLQHFKEVGVEVHVVQMAPLALCNYVAFDLLTKDEGAAAEEEPDEEDEGAGKKQCVVALDIGADSSNLVITDGDRIIWQRPIPLGGNHFTRALTKDLKLTFAKAEHVKRNAVKSPDLRKILAALKPVLNDFVSEVQRSLGYFTNTHRDAHVKYMMGLGNAFRLPGLQKYLQEKLQLEIRKLQGLKRLAGESVTSAPQFTENVPSFAVAYGLALQGLGVPRIQTNLLPHEIRFERMVRAKKPWATAAAAALVLAVAGLTFGRSVEWRSISNRKVEDALKKGETTVKKADGIRGDWKRFDDAVTDSKKKVRDIAAGVEERFNWNLLYKYVNDALPQPTGANKKLAERSRDQDEPRKYDNEKASAAYVELLKKQILPPPGAKVPDAKQELETDNKIKKYLIQINIDGIDAEWSDDLAVFYKNLIAEKDNELTGLTGEEKKSLGSPEFDTPVKLPKSGWVVGIRGSTYHEDGWKFVLNTLVENLAKPEQVGNDYDKQAKDLEAQVKKIRERLEALDKQLGQGEDKDKTDSKEAGKTDDKEAGKGEDKEKAKADDKEAGKGEDKDKALPKLDAKQRATLVAQKKLVEQELKEKELLWKNADEMKKGVRDKISFLFLYRSDTVTTPEGGGLAQTSVLPALLGDAAGGGQGGPGSPVAAGKTPAAGKMSPGGGGSGGVSMKQDAGDADAGPKTPSRSGWTPLGEIAAAAMAGGGRLTGGSGGLTAGAFKAGSSMQLPPSTAPTPAGKTPTAAGGRAHRQPRTEFIILLIWQEPLPPTDGAAAPQQ